MASDDDFLRPHRDGIHVIDTGFHRPRFDASYLIVENGRGVFVDTGTNHSVPRLLAALERVGLQRDAVDWVIPTHVHLDHAGGAGLLMQALPQARLLVHPRGARHMIDPTRLVAGATAVYGAEEMARSYGDVIGVDERRVVTSSDGLVLDFAGRPLRILDTPGHARHHHCVWDERSRGVFTGDTFGLSYPEFETDRGAWALPTTTPVQFEPDALRDSMHRIVALEPRWLYPTHFGPLGDVPALAAMLVEQLDAVLALGQTLAGADDRHAALSEGLARIYLERLRAHGCRLPEADIRELLAMDIELNAQGMGIWLDRSNKH